MWLREQPPGPFSCGIKSIKIDGGGLGQVKKESVVWGIMLCTHSANPRPPPALSSPLGELDGDGGQKIEFLGTWHPCLPTVM